MELTQTQRDTIRSHYDKALEILNQIKEIFIDYYGEERIDVQDYPEYNEQAAIEEYETQIALNRVEHTEERFNTYFSYIFKIGAFSVYVHFPEVTIVNENDDQHTIHDMWARVVFDGAGHMIGSFQLMKSTYTKREFQVGYTHSHVAQMSPSSLGFFETPCVGTGPIRDTMAILAEDFIDFKIALFCRELDMYTHNESIKGVPYIRMSALGYTGGYNTSYSNRIEYRNNLVYTSYGSLLHAFIPSFLRDNFLVFSYYNNSYHLGISYTEFTVKLSNSFISFYNNECKEKCKELTNRFYAMGFLRESYIENDKIFYKSGNSALDIRNREDPYKYDGLVTDFTFKGNPITIHIKENVDESTEKRTEYLLIEKPYVEHMLYLILRTINYYDRSNISIKTVLI